VIRALRVAPLAFETGAIVPAIEWLAMGGIVAFPTDTLYGLAVDPFSSDAVAAVFDLKGRASTSAIPLLAASVAQVEAWFGAMTGSTAAIAREFWPGPLSLIIDAPPALAPAVHAGTATVAVRVPAHALARGLAAAFGRPITATSANLSGAPAVASAAELGIVGEDARVLVIDAGPSPGGAPSTIVDARTDTPRLVREGAIAWERVLRSTNR
jgi:L-threonylcarbamoyladenylate synthase